MSKIRSVALLNRFLFFMKKRKAEEKVLEFSNQLTRIILFPEKEESRGESIRT